jgi:hypothetical protein
MIPVGYLAKRVFRRPDWHNAADVADLYSVSSCISRDFADYIKYGKHNGYWLFDSPKIIQDLAAEIGIDLAETTLFFYEAYELQIDETSGRWTEISPDSSFPTQVVLPKSKALVGYDIVTYSCGTTAECSPLSCNQLALEVETNQHCLITSFERAKQLIEEGKFHNSEPGPFRILEVHTTDWT